MKVFTLYYKNGKHLQVEAKTTLELIRKYDLTSRKNTDVKIMEIASY